jgi:glucose/mannose-6-phosphate isomerase
MRYKTALTGDDFMVTHVLDNPEKIKLVDKSGMIDFALNAAHHYSEAAKVADHIAVEFPKPANIIVAGLGGSAIGGDIMKDWAKNQLKVPIEVSREYKLPAYAGKKTLVLICSYSGDTEETLGTFLDALKRGCMVYCISSGGAVIKYAKKHKVPYLQVPGGLPPRAALPYMLVPLLIFMEKMGLVKGVKVELAEATALLNKISQENGPDTPTRDNFAKTTAYHIGDTAPTVYGWGIFQNVARRFKQQFNENSKSAAKWEYLPELDHNEIVGWECRGEQIRYFSVIFIRDIDDEPAEIESRLDITKGIMERAGLIMFDLKVEGKTPLAKIISTIVVGDFISVYLAVMRCADPTPVNTINYLKNELAKNGVKDKIINELEKL